MGIVESTSETLFIKCSTTACDWAITPIFQPCFTKLAITCAPTYVFPVPGGP